MILMISRIRFLLVARRTNKAVNKQKYEIEHLIEIKIKLLP